MPHIAWLVAMQNCRFGPMDGDRPQLVLLNGQSAWRDTPWQKLVVAVDGERRIIRLCLNGSYREWALADFGPVDLDVGDNPRWRIAGETPWALKMRTEPIGTSAGSSTKRAPLLRSSSTTWRLWTISWRT